ncbi:MAG: hypothetical protein SWH78_15665 [Thermodesulfobacteriota bacterium]|nr:hypothetical protein [Thermodesulfobacteriota bacterium]
MKHRQFMLACLIVFLAVFGIFSFASAGYNLSLLATSDGSTPKTGFQRGDDLYLHILLDDPTGVAGCAFTLMYPADVVNGPDTTAQGTPVTQGDIVSSFPFTYNSNHTHRENASESGKIYFSGAAINTPTGGSRYDSAQETVLFTVKFSVRNNAPFGHFQFSLTQSGLWNLKAGYGTDNNSNGQYDVGVDEKDTVPVLVGAVDNEDDHWDDLSEAFPVLLGGDTTPFTPSSLVLLVLDDDSIDNDWEIQHFGNLDTADDTTDFDQDGYLDRYEQPSQNNTDPVVDDGAYALPHYDPATDDRGPYQVASMAPKVLPALPGSDIALTVKYDVSDGDNTLSSFGVRVHFDSTKLDYIAFQDFFETDKSGDPEVHDDTSNHDNDACTDSFILIHYPDLVGQSWPSEPLPLDLVTLQFTVKAQAAAGQTLVNVSQVTGDIGYEFAGNGSTITATFPPGSITGTVAYDGNATGTFDIGAYSDEKLENLVAETTQDAPGGFEIADVPPGTYYIGAKLDLVSTPDREPAGKAPAPVVVVSAQSVDAGTITVYHIATNIVLEANPSRISSMTPSESTLTATIMDDYGYAVTNGPDSTLEVFFIATPTALGDIKVGDANPAVAANGVATIMIVSKLDDEGGEVLCTADATGAQGQELLDQGTVIVETAPFAIVPQGPIALLVNETQEFSIVGGAPPYTWGVEGGGSLDKTTTQRADEKVTFTAPEQEILNMTLTVTDANQIGSKATIHVYDPVAIPDKPTEPPIVKAGDSSVTFTVGGWDENYVWTATDAGGTPVDVQEGPSYAFTAPMDGPFAGMYTITVGDGNQFSDTFDVYVPMAFTPQSMNILGGEAFGLTLAGADSDSAQISGAVFLDEDLNVVATEGMADYATFAPDLPIDFDENSEAVITVTGADVTAAMRFQFRATVTGDADLTEENGLNMATTGWIRVLPELTYSGIVQEAATGSPIETAVVIFKLGEAIQGEPVLTGESGGFSASLPSPAPGGPEYDVEVLADGYVSSTGMTTGGWDMVAGETIELTEAVSSITGTVHNDVAGGAIQQARLACEVSEQTCLAYTDNNGDYALYVPELDAGDSETTTWTYQTTNHYADPCEPEDDDAGTATMTEEGNNVTIVVDDGPTFTGTVDGSAYHLTTSYTDGAETCTETVDFTLSLSGTEGSGTLAWSCRDDGVTCSGESDLTLTKQDGGGLTEIFATASALGYTSVRQDILDDADFVLTALGSGDEVGLGGGALTSGDCTIDIPAGALDGTAVIQIDCDIDVGTESPYTENSVALVEITVTGANIVPNNPIQVTIPFDTTDVNPGDFMAGMATINYAETVEDLRNGTNVNRVPTEDIVYEDHLNGLVSFWLTHASVFGVGGSGGPAVTTGPATSVGESTATLTGILNPNGLATTYYFEYGKDTNYGKSTQEADGGSGSDHVEVKVGIVKLKDDTVYHFRLVAMNSTGVTYGKDMTFKTRDDDDDTCFIQTAASGLSLEQRVPPPATFAHKALPVIVMLGLVVGASIRLRRS